EWHIHRTPLGLASFIIIGVMAGMFGLGAGWANVPVLNLMMGAPLKISVASSKFLLSITDTSAAWIYLNKGCVIPMMVVPSLIGIMLGSLVGVKILVKAKPAFIRWMVIGILAFAGIKALTKGLGITLF
ncbi:MAG: sulfite exporter TauE/SafE family protein, partial [Deltaproteobacteria bacterium]|nr:sulfite exporter TauE/SafE family protein [Deltaproteobacteria bacterium]